jgi:hypothetical protein
MSFVGLIEVWLRANVALKELGWEEVGEKFTRFVLFRCRWFSVYLHKLDAPLTPENCHDHPWHFWTFILSGGYWEDMNGRRTWRGAGSLLYRTARSLHNTTTLERRPMWSLVIVSRKVRPWSMRSCGAAPAASHWLTAKEERA